MRSRKQEAGSRKILSGASILVLATLMFAAGLGTNAYAQCWGANFLDKEFDLVQGQVETYTNQYYFTGNCSDTTVTFYLDADCSWLSFSPASGQCPYRDKQYVDLTVDARNLSSGYHSCRVEITTNDSEYPGPYEAYVDIFVDSGSYYGDVTVSVTNATNDHGDGMNAVILFQNGTEVDRKTDPSGSSVTFQDVDYGSNYSVQAYAYDQLIGETGYFSVESSSVSKSISGNPTQDLLVGVLCSDQSTRLAGASVYLWSWNNYLQEWTYRVGQFSDANGECVFDVWPTTDSVEKYALSVEVDGDQVGRDLDVKVPEYASGTSVPIITDVECGCDAPGKASSPTPSHGASGVSENTSLTWAAASDATTYSVYFGTDSSPDSGEYQGNQSSRTFDPGTLQGSTTYYWRIDAINDCGTTTGDVWRFTTGTIQPTFRAVVVGIADYPGTEDDLNFCDDDATDFRMSLLEDTRWNSTNVELLIDSHATVGNIQSALSDMVAQAGTNDTCVFFFSGHGGTTNDVSPMDESDGRDEFLLAYDGTIRDDQIAGWLSELRASTFCAFIDSCFAGGMKTLEGGNRIKTVNVGGPAPTKDDGFAADLMILSERKDLSDSLFFVATASREDETSEEHSDLQNGVFTEFLLEAMEMECADANGNAQLSGEEAISYLAPLATAANPDQHPQGFDGNGSTQSEFHVAGTTPCGSTADLTMARSADCYTPGGYADITVSWSGATESISSFGLIENIPSGWTYDSLVSGPSPVQQPSAGQSRALEFAWTGNPNGQTVVYRLNVPSSQDSPASISGYTAFVTTAGADGQTGNVSTTIDQPCTQYHDADTDQNWSISIQELLRVIAYYSEGSYHVQSGTSDGYAPGGGSQSGSPHSADYGGNWAISIQELLRVIAYYSEGAYHSDSSTSDGYAPGAGSKTAAAKAITFSMARQTIPSVYPCDGGTLDVEVTWTGSEVPASFSLTETLPSGWTFDSVVSGPSALVAPSAGQSGTLEFAWAGSAVSALPATLVYRLNVPSSVSGTVSITGNANWVAGDGSEGDTGNVVTQIQPDCEGDDDADGDGIPDDEEGAPDRDTDGDGTPDYLDTDSDNDGYGDATENAHGTDPYNAADYPDPSSLPLAAGAIALTAAALALAAVRRRTR